MLDRRSFLAATLGAATFPMPALARAEPAIVRIRETPLVGPDPDAPDHALAAGCLLVRNPAGGLLAVWQQGESPATQVLAHRFTDGLRPVGGYRRLPTRNGSGLYGFALGDGGGLYSSQAGYRRVTLAGAPAGPVVPYLPGTDKRNYAFDDLVATSNGRFHAQGWVVHLDEDGQPKNPGGVFLSADGRPLTRPYEIVADAGVVLSDVATVACGDGVLALVAVCTETKRRIYVRKVAFGGRLGPAHLLEEVDEDGMGPVLRIADLGGGRFAVHWLCGGSYAAVNRVVVVDAAAKPLATFDVGYLGSQVALFPAGKGRIAVANFDGWTLIDRRKGAVSRVPVEPGNPLANVIAVGPDLFAGVVEDRRIRRGAIELWRLR
ncbi:hypothetical protein [Oharaeibacter diazotrophicus]|uniref:Uncharacterized protein n=1 Tax=Oharaeibacter diazotrophicus TaxID=1920512 RepID=A0A4R6R8P2_9HYPH|nr:hypothetical protein [Oharaeibacter diazotrophicus]TDP81947.1 hypothetical protein EDD54_4208 [Oharaeibacter diazotrophicus]BBE73579.1 hypothetical protein OHA_1_03193 [Pleomorphomonas sp. SM30]GLS75369.1 hypothetical protein GCM10007904_07040 [Oharaeibacter diazotrophicus]